MSGFGKKGVAAGVTQPSARVVTRNTAAREPDPLAAEREAFIAAERARRAEAGNTDSYDSGELPSYTAQAKPSRSVGMAYLLWFVLGQLSIHRFYLGATQSALIQAGMWIVALVLLIGGQYMLGLAIGALWALWLFSDVFTIPSIHRQHCR